MTDHHLDLRDLLSDAVDEVEPGYGLDKIRARTKTPKPRWPYAAGASLLAIAASLTAFAVLGNDAPPVASDPASSTSVSPSPSPGLSPSPSDAASPSASATGVPSEAVAVYYIGQTPQGPRLYREFQPVPADDTLRAAVAAAVNGQSLDPDYGSGWPQSADTFLGATVEAGVIKVEVGDPAVRTDYDSPEWAAEMAIQQVIYTAQAAVQERLPVQFVYRGNPVAEVLGVPTSEPLANGPVLDTLALVSLTTPSEGMVVDNDKPLMIEGVGNSFEGNIVTRIQRPDGTEVVDPQPAVAGWGEDKLFPFQTSFDLTSVAPGDYVVVSQTDDPSGEGRFHEDTRTITISD